MEFLINIIIKLSNIILEHNSGDISNEYWSWGITIPHDKLLVTKFENVTTTLSAHVILQLN